MTTLQPLRVLPLPRTEPPVISYDEARATMTTTESPYVQDALAIDYTPDDERYFDRQRSRSSDLPDPERFAPQLAQALVEVMAGARPAPQVIRWTSPEVYAVVARRSALVARRVADGNAPRTRPRLRVLRVRICEPADGVAEAAVVVSDGPRVRAVAVRLVGQDGKWRVSALQVG